jgi:hypothetical protein
MNSIRLSWGLLLFWSAWAHALTGFLASGLMSPRWVPDLGLLLFLAVAARLGRKDLATSKSPPGFAGLVLVTLIARVAFSVQAVAPILAGLIAVLFWQNALRRGIDVERPLIRIVVVAGASLMLLAWWHFVREANLPAIKGGPAMVSWLDDGAWRGVLLTSALAPIAMPLCLGLPGLGPLWRRR